jgi:hypothetical protein
MALRIFRNGKLVKEWSSTTGKTDFNEKNEMYKPVSLYNVEKPVQGLSDETIFIPLSN